MLNLLVKFKGKVLKNIETDKAEITIGRDEDNDVVIDNLGVSKQHARIIKHLDRYAVEDLKSTNGTFLNNKKVNFAKLSDKDTVTIGKHALEISYLKPTKTEAPRTVVDDTIKMSRNLAR